MATQKNLSFLILWDFENSRQTQRGFRKKNCNSDKMYFLKAVIHGFDQIFDGFNRFLMGLKAMIVKTIAGFAVEYLQFIDFHLFIFRSFYVLNSCFAHPNLVQFFCGGRCQK